VVLLESGEPIRRWCAFAMDDGMDEVRIEQGMVLYFSPWFGGWYVLLSSLSEADSLLITSTLAPASYADGQNRTAK
jgi:hypothetical protein